MPKSRIEKLNQKFPLLDREKLYDLYVEQQKSLPLIRQEYGIDFKACRDLLIYYGIPVRTISQSRTTSEGKRRIISSLREKYGVENPSQIESVKEKKRQTFQAHYGVDNIWKSPSYYKWLEDYMLIHYGVKRLCTNPWGWRGDGEKRKDERIQKLWKGRDVWWLSLSDEEKSSIMAYISSKNTYGSKIEGRVRESLDRLHISHKRWVFIGHRNFDFEIDGCNILIEVNGDFWHANPSKYSGEDSIPFPNGHKKAREIWKQDETKRLLAERKGYKLLTLWESDLKSMSDKDLELWIVKNIVI